jgi:DNA-binding HxlR family transcriptional regulator
MAGYGQFCSMARAHEVLGVRWTLLIVRELLGGSCRFNDIRRGIPRISRTVLSERLQSLALEGLVARVEGAHGPEYELTQAGAELGAVIGVLATWGQRWLSRRSHQEDLDLAPLLADMRRGVRSETLPKDPLVIRLEIDRRAPWFLLLKAAEVSVCQQNPGFPEPLRLKASLPAIVAWWRGDVSFTGAQRMGLSLEGPRSLVRAFPNWFDRYPFAAVGPAPEAESLRVGRGASLEGIDA